MNILEEQDMRLGFMNFVVFPAQTLEHTISMLHSPVASPLFWVLSVASDACIPG